MGASVPQGVRGLRTDTKNRRRAVFVDLDSTLCDTRQRWHMINAEDKASTDWEAYSQACADDEPFPGPVRLVQLLYEVGFAIVILSARDEVARAATEDWLQRHHIPYDALYLRQRGDKKPLAEYKRAVLESVAHNWIPELFIDDWPPVKDALADLLPVVIVNPMYGTPGAPVPTAGDSLEAEATYVK